MPNRIIKESICVSDSIDKLTWFEEVLFYRLMVNCDDYGRFDGRVSVIKNRLFPLKDNVTVKAVSDAINKLVSAELVVLYEYEGKPYLHLPTWNEHQVVRAKRSKYPAPDNNLKASEIICNHMQADVSVIQSESESESESNPKGRARQFIPPTLEEIEAYCRERNSSIDPKAFYDYFNTPNDRGETWVDSKGNKVKNWRQKLITWEGHQQDKPSHTMNYKQRRYSENELVSMGNNMLGE